MLTLAETRLGQWLLVFYCHEESKLPVRTRHCDDTGRTSAQSPGSGASQTGAGKAANGTGNSTLLHTKILPSNYKRAYSNWSLPPVKVQQCDDLAHLLVISFSGFYL